MMKKCFGKKDETAVNRPIWALLGSSRAEQLVSTRASKGFKDHQFISHGQWAMTVWMESFQGYFLKGRPRLATQS